MKVNAMYDQVIFRESLNPFVKRKTNSGLYIPAGVSFTDETGDMETMDKIVGFGIVAEVGSETRYVKPGDAIFYDRRSVRAVPAGEVLWNMSERGMVAYVKADDPDLQAAFARYAEEETEITNSLKANAAKEDAVRQEKLRAIQADIDNGKEFKSSPLIKIN